MTGAGLGRFALALAATAALALPGSAAAAAGDVVIKTHGICCAYEHDLYEMTAGTVATFQPQGGSEELNVTSLATYWPGGPPLFQSATIRRATTPVIGTEYLTPGDYPFYSNNFGFKTMNAVLRVQGGTPRPRPQIEATLLSRRLRAVRRRGFFVRLDASTLSKGIAVEITRAGELLGSASGVDLAAGTGRALPLKLTREGRAALRGRRRAKVAVNATVPFGFPATEKATLR